MSWYWIIILIILGILIGMIVDAVLVAGYVGSSFIKGLNKI